MSRPKENIPPEEPKKPSFAGLGFTIERRTLSDEENKEEEEQQKKIDEIKRELLILSYHIDQSDEKFKTELLWVNLFRLASKACHSGELIFYSVRAELISLAQELCQRR